MSIPTVKLERNGYIIERTKVDYENNKERFKMRGFTPLNDIKKEIKKATVKDITDKVVQLKPKKKTRKKK